jgi:quercetin dioxygenase-like cupin family protein
MMLRPSIPVLLIVAFATAAAQDPIAVSPKDSPVEVDNPWVRVLRVKQDPHEKTPMQEHPASVSVYLTDVHQRFTGEDGKAREVQHKSGDVAYAGAVKRAEENLSDKPLELVLIELKPGAPKPVSPPITLDPVKLDPKHHIVVLENDRVRAIRTILEPHLKSPMHEHPHYVVVYITELHTTQKLGDGRLVDNPRKPGEVAWRDALKHETENICDRTAVEIQVELK